MAELPLLELLYVCAGSGGLFGLLVDGAGCAAYEQRCLRGSCPHRDEPWHQPQTHLPEPCDDFPTAVELCYCCASEVIRSGSRWSSFFCDSCRVLVVRLRDEIGFAAIPLGRHSIMNGVALSGTSARDPGEIQRFVTATHDFASRIQRLEEWRRLVIADHNVDMGHDAPYISVPLYLDFTRRKGLSADEMFRQLCRYFGVEP